MQTAPSEQLATFAHPFAYIRARSARWSALAAALIWRAARTKGALFRLQRYAHLWRTPRPRQRPLRSAPQIRSDRLPMSLRRRVGGLARLLTDCACVSLSLSLSLRSEVWLRLNAGEQERERAQSTVPLVCLFALDNRAGARNHLAQFPALSGLLLAAARRRTVIFSLRRSSGSRPISRLGADAGRSSARRGGRGRAIVLAASVTLCSRAAELCPIGFAVVQLNLAEQTARSDCLRAAARRRRCCRRTNNNRSDCARRY